MRGISIVAWPLDNGEPKPDWKPGTNTFADIRPGSFLQRSYEERQRKPDDLEAHERQRPIAIHALENLAHSDTGIVMPRRLLREQLQRVEQDLDPINVIRDPFANKRIPTGAWNTILSPAEAAAIQRVPLSRDARRGSEDYALDPRTLDNNWPPMNRNPVDTTPSSRTRFTIARRVVVIDELPLMS